VAKNLASLFGGMLGGSVSKNLMEGVTSIGPVEYTDIAVGEDRWTEARLIGDAFEMAAGSELVPRQAGSATLRVTIKASEFAGQRFETEQELTIAPIYVTVEPLVTRLKPRESVVLTATVENAEDERVSWRMEPDAGFRMAIQGGGMSVRVTAPEQPDVAPVVVTATSEADRSFLVSAPVREGGAHVRPAALSLDPPTACLLPEEDLQFTVEADEQLAWNWSTTAGDISGSGTFSAPATGDGRATVTVRDPGDPQNKAEATVAFGKQCSCHGWVELGAPVGRRYVGLAGWRQRDGQFTIGFTPAMSAEQALANPAARLELGTVYPGTPSVGNHTLHLANLAGFLNAENQIYGIVDPTTTGTGSGVASLKHVDADRLEGTFVGYISVLMRDPGKWIQAPVTFGFRALRGSMTEQGPFLECYLAATAGAR
jgi:hypothetical protein